MGLGGAIIGGIIGSFFGGWGTFIGASIGGMMGNEKKTDDTDATDSAENAAQGHTIALTALFQSFGCLAKADGIVSQEEADFVSGVLASLEISDKATRDALIGAFNEGKKLTGQYDYILNRVKKCYQTEAYVSIMETYCGLVLADGRIDTNEKLFLATAERIFGLPDFSRQFFARYEHDSGNSYSYDDSRNYRGSSSGGDSRSRGTSSSLDADYALLGIPSSASDSEVKSAYRRKIVEFHPDKIQGKGLNDAFVAFATEQTNKINAAYERICQARGIR